MADIETTPEATNITNRVTDDQVVEAQDEQVVSVSEGHSEDQTQTVVNNQEEEAHLSTEPPSIPLTPPNDSVQVTKDGGVLKKVLKAGDGSKPTLHARCLIHYVGYLASNGEKFLDTRKDRETEEPVVVVAGRTAAAQETGLCLAAATMSKGEKALVYIEDPGYGYGKTGSFSFPCVPPESKLVYEVEMVNWEGIEETDNDQNRGSLLYEERLERAERRREAGNALYKEGKFKEALAKYAMALSYMDEDFMYQLEGHYLDKAEAVKLRIHLNMAAAQLNTGDYNTAIYNCGQVLQIDPQNVKALFRRGKARHTLGRTEEAQADLEAALKIDPFDKAILAEMQALKATMRKEREAQAALFKGRLKPNSSASDTTALPAGQSTPAASNQQPSQQPSDNVDGTAATSSGATANEIGAGGVTKRATSASVKTAAVATSAAVGATDARHKAYEALVGGGAKGQKGKRVKTQQPPAAGMLGVLLWLWSMLVAVVLGGRRRSVAASGK